MPISPNGWKQVCADEDVTPPRRPPSRKVMLELYVGRQSAHMMYWKERMPKHLYARLKTWYEAHYEHLTRGL